jgi:hypothetical protein
MRGCLRRDVRDSVTKYGSLESLLLPSWNDTAPPDAVVTFTIKLLLLYFLLIELQLLVDFTVRKKQSETMFLNGALQMLRQFSVSPPLIFSSSLQLRSCISYT